MQSITFLKALLIILYGPDELVGPGYKWKRCVLSLAILSLVVFPLSFFNFSSPYQGKIPAPSQVMHAKGRFHFGEEHHGIKTAYFAEFAADDGHTYRLKDVVGLDDIRQLVSSNANQQFDVSGFVLQDGRGAFWPLEVKAGDGAVLLDAAQQREMLDKARDPFGALTWAWVLTIPLWVVSFSNAMKLMK